MMKYIVFGFFILAFAGCGQTNKLQTQDPNKGLKDYFKKYFPVGVAVNVRALSGPDSAFITKEFNSLTPENDLKIGPVHPAENQYNFRNGDAIVAFAQRNNFKVRGHNLVW